jgi:sulfane dehydrogenase subunit SoxC
VLPQKGWWEISGLAWSGRGRIAAVDVSMDGGRRWARADLDDPVLPKCHTRFRFLWNWKGGEAVLMSRATDETGYVQPTLEQLVAARGAGTNYHLNNIRSWRVQRDGHVVFGLSSP